MSPPLNPFPPSPLFSAGTSLSVSQAQIALWLFLIVVAVWIFYSLVLIYHWLRYSHAPLSVIPALGIYLGGSVLLILYAASGLA